MVMDIRTHYLGLELAHPVVASASPLTADLEGILRVADAGASAIVMASVFEEDIRAQELAEAALWETGENSHPEAAGYFPVMPHASPLDGRLAVLRSASERAGVPIIASLNGCTPAGWLRFAKDMEQAGASAIELNFWHIPTNPDETGAQVEERCIQILRDVRAQVKVPVSVKLSPFFSSLGNMVKRLSENGADGIVLFNSFYEPGLRSLTDSAEVDFIPSSAYELRLPLMWAVLLSEHCQADLAISGGVHSGMDVAKCLLAGADVAMVTSVLLQQGPSYISTLLEELREWMSVQKLGSVKEFKGRMAARGTATQAEDFLRTQYRHILSAHFTDIAG
ncbi:MULTISPECIES: dihydroorotate dehydrogenase-like protein [Acetobacter]|nr:dihydroorotate dehydrogenase-like protein [Acetobacter pomorum]AXC26668.1 dihydroorotate dehydrogenase-like protein [Acetobacter sp. JWB]ATI13217.1 diguanylate cyclase [Acetobacter pomorum]KAA8426199.1 dihydroorotate dehydrogenase-like protein [Acetobacter pomorum]KAA8431502.1 dihydroorotate dehydrogenase-like protein [Acetobacter pomorum]KAA8449149.1 dihydroorotate dehydrogenase-like protein [Acetobacter pomorum]